MATVGRLSNAPPAWKRELKAAGATWRVSQPVLAAADPSGPAIASVLIESLHVADPAAHEVRLQRLVGEDLLSRRLR
jgi:hypothetical protein